MQAVSDFFSGIRDKITGRVVQPAASATRAVAQQTGLAPVVSSDGASQALGTSSGDTMLGGRRRRGKKTMKKRSRKSKASRKH